MDCHLLQCMAAIREERELERERLSFGHRAVIGFWF